MGSLTLIESESGSAQGSYIAEHDDALEAVWRMTGNSSSIADASGNGHTLTAAGSPTYEQTGPDGSTANAIQLNTLVTDNLNIAAGFGKTAAQSWSINTWIRMPSALSTATIFSWGTNHVVDAIALSLSSSNNLELYERVSSSTKILYSTTRTLNLENDAWHMVTVTYDVSTNLALIYVNGIPAGQVDGGTPPLDASAHAFRFGSLNGSSQGWTGLISETRYWKGANGCISPAAVHELTLKDWY